MESPSKSLVELKFVCLFTYVLNLSVLYLSVCLPIYLPTYHLSSFIFIYQSINHHPSPTSHLLIQNLPWEKGIPELKKKKKDFSEDSTAHPC